MPMRDYRCDSCEKTVEVFQWNSEKPLEEQGGKAAIHEGCGGRLNMMRIPAWFVVRFVGSGFYQNDYNGRNASG